MHIYVYIYAYNYINLYFDFLKCRGFSNKNAKASRSWYSRLSETRSLLQSKITIIVLTATATTAMKTLKIKNLTTTDPITFRSSFEKFNIKYHVHNVKSMNISKHFPLFL